MRLCSIVALTLHLGLVLSQQLPGVGYPHDYPGKPKGDFSPAWQDCKCNVSAHRDPYSAYFSILDFEVKGSLPNITWPLPRTFAGNIPVDRPQHPNDTLFFWAWEKERGSLTSKESERQDEPWGIWLQGGSVLYIADLH